VLALDSNALCFQEDKLASLTKSIVVIAAVSAIAEVTMFGRA